MYVLKLLISMNRLETNYMILEQTMVLLPAREIEYQTIAFDVHEQNFIKKPIMKLIEEACVTYRSTYEGRRGAVIKRMNFKRKVPIPISIHRNIYAFPTHSPYDHECIWIFPKHIKAISSVPQDKNANAKSIVIFKNNMQLELPISEYELRKQISRTSEYASLFSTGVRF